LSPAEIIEEARKLPLPALSHVVEVLSFEAMGQMQENNIENQIVTGRPA